MPNTLKLNGVPVVPVTGLPAVTGFTLDAVRMRLKRDPDAPRPAMKLGRQDLYAVPSAKRWAERVRAK